MAKSNTLVINSLKDQEKSQGLNRKQRNKTRTAEWENKILNYMN